MTTCIVDSYIDSSPKVIFVQTLTVPFRSSYNNDSKRDSISASDVVDYLREFSKGMMNEVKSEIRDAVNAVDEIISPEGFLGSRKNSPPDILKVKSAGGSGGGGHRL